MTVDSTPTTDGLPRSTRGTPASVAAPIQLAQTTRQFEISNTHTIPRYPAEQRDGFTHLGELEIGTEHLEQAVDAFRAALEERTCERVPLDWAATQNNLGNALATLGELESGTERLEQAVDAFRAALKVFSDEGSPRYRTATQNNLAHALKMLSERGSARPATSL